MILHVTSSSDFMDAERKGWSPQRINLSGRRYRRGWKGWREKSTSGSASGQTYLYLGLVDIGRLPALVMVPSLYQSIKAYQIAHDDLAITKCRYIGGRGRFCGSFASAILLNSTDWSCSGDSGGVWYATATATADCTLATSAENLVKRLVKFSRHCEM